MKMTGNNQMFLVYCCVMCIFLLQPHLFSSQSLEVERANLVWQSMGASGLMTCCCCSESCVRILLLSVGKVTRCVCCLAVVLYFTGR